VLPADGALALPGRLLVAGWWVFWTVSAINVVNFMDGIDGIIGAQLAVYGAYVAAAAPAGSAAFVLGLTVAAAALGFLRWNWSPAAIFLGDVGSGRPASSWCCSASPSCMPASARWCAPACPCSRCSSMRP
jgi:UDP-N-acetylmuramyl pentapeptide phosphotransferase/UDP-N-acetylglucosamine-1-phosphate transferase